MDQHQLHIPDHQSEASTPIAVDPSPSHATQDGLTDQSLRALLRQVQHRRRHVHHPRCRHCHRRHPPSGPGAAAGPVICPHRHDGGLRHRGTPVVHAGNGRTSQDPLPPAVGQSMAMDVESDAEGSVAVCERRGPPPSGGSVPELASTPYQGQGRRPGQEEDSQPFPEPSTCSTPTLEADASITDLDQELSLENPGSILGDSIDSIKSQRRKSYLPYRSATDATSRSSAFVQRAPRMRRRLKTTKERTDEPRRRGQPPATVLSDRALQHDPAVDEGAIRDLAIEEDVHNRPHILGPELQHRTVDGVSQNEACAGQYTMDARRQG